MRNWSVAVLALTLAGTPHAAKAQADPTPFLGQWAISPEGGGASWLEVTQEDGYLDARLLWLGGSVSPVASVYVSGDVLTVTRRQHVQRRNAEGQVVREHDFTETYRMSVQGDTMRGARVQPGHNGLGESLQAFTGVREPAMPPAPDLSKVTFGDPVNLLPGPGLDGWSVMGENNGWRFEDGLLINDAAQPEHGHVRYANIRTNAEFEDFNLTLRVKVPPKGNSGIYLRGIYEVQVMDSYGMETDTHHMGGIYSRIAPSVAAERPADTWQDMDITLVDRHVTVKLNGTVILDNQPLFGCTGGALWADVTRPGPIYLQGDHTSVTYRDVVLRPVVK